MARLSTRLGTFLVGLCGVVLVVVALAILAVALRPEDEPRSLVIIGDTITADARADLQRELLDERVRFEVENGSMFRTLVDSAESLSASPPDVIVFNLGTSDLVCATQNGQEEGSCAAGFPDFSAGQLEDDIAAFVEPLPASSCVIAVNLEGAPGADINAFLQDWHDEGTIDVVADWAGRAASPEVRSGGQVHDGFVRLTEYGAKAYAEFVREQIDENC